MDDVLVVGEALVDIVERPDGARAEHPGGSPANVALGLARLGRRTSLLTRIGRDGRGDAVRKLLEGSGVQVHPASFVDAPTSTATARLDAHGAARYDFDLDWRLPRDPILQPARALHTGSIAAFLPPGGDAVLELVQSVRGSRTVSYDPNARPVLMGEPRAARRRVESLVAAADVVKVSDEDLEWLAPGEDPERVARSWIDLGPAVVVVTYGAGGTLGVTREVLARVRAPQIEVVDTVGAGDAFMSGLLDHLAGAGLLGPEHGDALRTMDEAAVRAMLAHAARVAAVTCTRAGADPPTREELAAAVLG